MQWEITKILSCENQLKCYHLSRFLFFSAWSEEGMAQRCSIKLNHWTSYAVFFSCTLISIIWSWTGDLRFRLYCVTIRLCGIKLDWTVLVFMLASIITWASAHVRLFTCFPFRTESRVNHAWRLQLSWSLNQTQLQVKESYNGYLSFPAVPYCRIYFRNH